MQLACIFDNLETQEWHNQDKIFIEKQKNLPKFFARGRRKYLKREKKRLIKRENSGILRKLA